MNSIYTLLVIELKRLFISSSISKGLKTLMGYSIYICISSVKTLTNENELKNNLYSRRNILTFPFLLPPCFVRVKTSNCISFGSSDKMI